MRLRPVDHSDLGVIAAWLAQPENYQWLDFGALEAGVSPVRLQVMIRSDTNVYRVFTEDVEDLPIGIAVLSNLNRNFKTAMLWYVLGDKRFSGRGYTSLAVSKLLSFAFNQIGLQAINAWAVDQNVASIRVLEHNHFRLIGRQRQCHVIDGSVCDRLLFDILVSEHKPA